ncbi:hypothetical protein O4H49_15160 [Kiloniella laminariae]|uniref:Transposase n=1 Tax=Kiloniella laminariae TaxID=454162 RepID=A0ABT4LM39_9PROT|nr:hypothetical protein [Kiloniella laminariae]MCZ4282126.1 hypothetical protein [Kiloniella laminariae]
MMKQRKLFGIDDQLRRLSDLGDQLELLGSVVDLRPSAAAWSLR